VRSAMLLDETEEAITSMLIIITLLFFSLV
jgi:hypothetical protein